MTYNFDELSSRIGTNCAKFDEMNRYYGTDVMHLGVADMDFVSPQPILDTLEAVAKKGIFGYTILPENYPALVKGWMSRRYGCDIKEDWVLFSPRINMAVNMAVETFTEKGDSIILHTPAYTALEVAITKQSRQLLDSPLEFDGIEYRMNFESLEKRMSPSVKMLLLCNPHNPTCRVWRRDELEELAYFCKKYDLLLLSDEIHADILPEGSSHCSILSMGEDLRQRAILCNSITKTFNIPGIILSNVIIPNPDLRSRMMQTIDRWGLHNPNIFAAAILQPAYTQCDDWLEQVNRYIRGNYDFLGAYFKKYLPGFCLMPSESTYLAWVDCRGICSEKKLEEFLLKKAKVSVYFGSRYSKETTGFIRINLATSRGYLSQALDRIRDQF